MSQSIPTAAKTSIRDAGFDEYWLQTQIDENPGILGLGELEMISREKKVSSGGRIDLLLKNPEDDSMYEVEVMLGATDESHIIRCIEYWDLEKRRWPQRQHYAVIIAEEITRRFFNVISLLSLNIPLIAIQANLLKANEQKFLNFTKILDLYEEPEDLVDTSKIYNEKYWKKKASWTIDNAKKLQSIVNDVYGETKLSFVKSYISIYYNNNIQFSFNKRSADRSLLSFRADEINRQEILQLLDAQNITPIVTKNQIRFATDSRRMEKDRDLYIKIAEAVKKYWDK